MKNLSKGCINDNCLNNRKKISYKKDDMYCSKCGNTLVHVCKDCRIPLYDEEVYCVRCKAEREDKKDKAAENAKGALKAAAGVASIAVAVITKGKIGGGKA